MFQSSAPIHTLTKGAFPSWQAAGLPRWCSSTSCSSRSCFLHLRVDSLRLRARASRPTSQDPTRSSFGEREGREILVPLGPSLRTTPLPSSLCTHQEQTPEHAASRPPRSLLIPKFPGAQGEGQQQSPIQADPESVLSPRAPNPDSKAAARPGAAGRTPHRPSAPSAGPRGAPPPHHQVPSLITAKGPSVKQLFLRSGRKSLVYQVVSTWHRRDLIQQAWVKRALSHLTSCVLK